MLTPLLLTCLSLPADAAEVHHFSGPAEPTTHDRAVRAPSRDRGMRGPAARAQRSNFRAGEAIAVTGIVIGASGGVLLGVSTWGGTPGHLQFSQLNVSAGLLAGGGLLGTAGALGAAITLDNATPRRAVPVVAGALGLTLGIFAPTFFGVGAGLRMPGFSIAAASTGAVATGLALLQTVQCRQHLPRRWRAGIDPVRRGVLVSRRF